MWILKGCPRCKGDMLVDRDFNGWYQSCLQCGYYGDLENTIKTIEQHPERKTTGDSLRGHGHRSPEERVLRRMALSKPE